MERAIALIAAGVLALAVLLFGGGQPFLVIWIIGIVVAYFVLKSFRSDHSVLLALLWPIGAIVLGIAQLLNGQPAIKQTRSAAAPPPPPRVGMIGDDDEEWEPASSAAPPPPPPPPRP